MWNNNAINKPEVCGTCRYCRFDPAEDDWYCDCEDADEYTEYVRYEYHCDEYEERT